MLIVKPVQCPVSLTFLKKLMPLELILNAQDGYYRSFYQIYPMRGFFSLGTFRIPDSTIAIKKYNFLIFHKNGAQGEI